MMGQKLGIIVKSFALISASALAIALCACPTFSADQAVESGNAPVVAAPSMAQAPDTQAAPAPKELAQAESKPAAAQAPTAPAPSEPKAQASPASKKNLAKTLRKRSRQYSRK